MFPLPPSQFTKPVAFLSPTLLAPVLFSPALARLLRRAASRRFVFTDEKKPSTAVQKAENLASSVSDTPHFIQQAEFQAPIESSLSVPAKKDQLVAKASSDLAKKQSEEVLQYSQPHPVWTEETVNAVRVTHLRPECLRDWMAYSAVRALRASFDLLSGYSLGFVDEAAWLDRIVFLETVAGVPGMVGAMVHHLQSLRKMERDYGWIHTLLEEAENERMHLMTALVLKKPSYLFRTGVLITQGLFLGAYSMSYLTSRRFAHRFVGYLEEEAVKTYTKLLEELENDKLPLFQNLPAPALAIDYWALKNGATFKDVILAIRADESHHREVNHTFAKLKTSDPNPFPAGH